MNERTEVQTQKATTPTLANNAALRRAAINVTSVNAVPPIVHDVLRTPGQPLDAQTRAFMEPRFGHDFSQVQTHSDHRVVGASPAHLLTFSGGVAANLWTGHNEVFVNGPGGGGTAPNPNSPAPVRRPQSPPTSAATNCPTDIKVAGVGQGNDRDFGQKGPITGWGGFALMEVSDPSGRTWDGTAIHETVRNIKNTCGDEGKKACTNQSGQGGGAGSTFTVGKEDNFHELAKLAAVRNRFYDIHSFADKRFSLLHLINQPSCEIQCEQFYDCGGRRFGSDFVITYSMTQGSVPRSGGGTHGVTRVEMSKAAKTTPAASPTAGSGGSTP